MRRSLVFLLLTGITWSPQASAAAGQTRTANTELESDLHVRSQETFHRLNVPPRTTSQEGQFQPPPPPRFLLPATLEEGSFQQDKDHFGGLPGQKFTQRFWIESSYASPRADAPILYHICGEFDATQSYILQDNAIEWAKALGAHIVYLEHRYYGQSLPFTDFSSDNMKYLTVDNALEDLATFQKSIAASRGWKGAWISVGGSYSGTISALYRQEHPELVVGALAASAPMISGVGVAYDSSPAEIQGLSATTPSADRSWLYQGCTLFGFWTADSFDFDAGLNLPSASFCQKVFGSSAPRFNSDKYNQDHDLPFISNSSGAPSNILFTYGTEDVWTRIGLSQQTNNNPQIQIVVINGGGHHFDLDPPDPADSPDVVSARNTFLSLAKKWLGQ